MIRHYDLFAGIGGFSLALDNVFGKENTKHIFVERDEFCQLVLKKHWPEAEYWSDINEFVANAKHIRKSRAEKIRKDSGIQPESEAKEELSFNESEGDDSLWQKETGWQPTILTGGFPCQPFSQAGRRKGTDDDRYLWPAMFESIKLIRPDWIVAENVAGLITWNEGMVLEQVCSDLESEGYEVQPFIIPACAVNAPHRRDRIWIIAHAKHNGCYGAKDRKSDNEGTYYYKERQNKFCESEGANSLRTEAPDWNQNWFEIATSFCRMDARISRKLDRNPRLKALGNAIVPQVAEEIFKAIRQLTE